MVCTDRTGVECCPGASGATSLLLALVYEYSVTCDPMTWSSEKGCIRAELNDAFYRARSRYSAASYKCLVPGLLCSTDLNLQYRLTFGQITETHLAFGQITKFHPYYT